MDHGNIVHPQFVTLNNGVRLHYASAGQPGQPLMLFVHGFPEFWYAWQAQLSAFGDAYYAVAPDLRGFNLSSKPAGPGEYHPKLIVDDLAQLIDALGYSRAIVVAHDWGGAVCWSLAIKFPQLIDKLVIVNAPHPWLFANALANDPAQQAASAYMNWLRQPGSEDALAANDFANLEKFFTAGGQSGASWYTPEVRGKYHAAWSVPGDGGSHGLTGGLNYYRVSPLHPPAGGEAAPDISKLVPEEWVVQVPTMVIWGESDTALPKTLLDGIERFVPDLRIERIPEGSHWVIHEQPERINTLIRGFVG